MGCTGGFLAGMRPRRVAVPWRPMRWTATLALLLAVLPAGAQVCAPTGSGGRSYRPAMTHRAPGAAPAAANISVATFQAWSPPEGAAEDGARDRDGPIDPREQRMATLEGDVWRVKVGDDGCDLTLELSATGAERDAPRVVAVIPGGPAYEAARAAVARAVGLRAGRWRGRVDLAEPVHVRLTGYLFWDGARWCEENPSRGCDRRADIVASLWELRPVWRADVAGAAPVETREAASGDGSGGGHHRRHHRRRHREREPE